MAIAGVLGLCVWMAQPGVVVPSALAQDGAPEPKEDAPGMRQGNPRVPISPPGLPGGPPVPAARPSTTKTADPAAESKTDGAGVIVSQNSGGTGGVTVKKVPCVPPSTKVSMDWVDTPLLDVTKYMAEITCRNFILGDKLDGQVTIISHQQVTVAEAYEAYLSALEVAGYTTVLVGKNTKVVKAGDASKAPLRIYEDDNIPETDNYVTQIIHLDNVSASDINTVVTQLGGPSVKVISYAPTNTLIVTDAAYNIRRVYRIIKQLDIAAPKATLEVIRLKYAAAADVQRILDDLFQVTASASSGGASASAAAASTPSRRRRATADAPETAAASSGTTVGSEGAYISKIMVDERTNSLIVLANDEAMARIKEVIAQVDIDIDPYSRATIHVIQLNYAKAQDVASVLSNLTQSGSSGSRSTSTSSTGRTTTTPTRSTTNPARTTGSTSAGGKRTANYGPAEESGGAGPDGLPVGPGGAGAQGGTSAVAAFDSGMRITADENTNRLLVIASPDDFKVIERVVRDLDIRRQQVYVEAVVVEVGSQDDRNSGIAYHFGTPSTEGGIQYGSSQLGASSLLLNTADLASGLAMGLLGPTVNVPLLGADGTITDTPVPAFGIAINALASNSQVDILSNPNVLCVDNEEATINVGRNVPFPVSAGRDNNNNPIVSYQREDVGITLKVTPQINEANYVTMDINLEVQEVEEDASSSLDVTTAGFITSKRQTENTVVVRDNQTIVLGGLIGNTQSTSESKIPILGDLPIVGVLFRSKKKSDRKTNLLIFLTPHVINDPADLEEVYRIKMAQREEFLRRFYGKSRENQEAEFAALMQSSMNLVDRPSAYRTKPAPVPDETREIVHPGDTPTSNTESVPQPATEPAASEPGSPEGGASGSPDPTAPAGSGGTP